MPLNRLPHKVLYGQLAAVRESPTQIVNVLKEVYGCSKSYVFWQQCFVKQKENESLFEFSHALVELVEKVKVKDEGHC